MRDMGEMTTSASTNASDTVNAVKHRKSKVEDNPEHHKAEETTRQITPHPL